MTWSREEIQFLHQNYAKSGIKFCAHNLHRSERAIKIQASRLKIKRVFWNSFEVLFLKNNYPLYGLKFCVDALGYPEGRIKEKIKKLHLQRQFLDPKVRRKLWYEITQNKLAHNIRVRTRLALVNAPKSTSNQKMLGCSFFQLQQHLESKFQQGMNWQNYGDWHIDHIKPCSSFNLSDEKEQRKCFHYSNLQPLWAKDNFSKGGKWTV